MWSIDQEIYVAAALWHLQLRQHPAEDEETQFD
jgi:hypothetical protein